MVTKEKLLQLKRQVSKLESLCSDIKRTINHIENNLENGK